MNYLLPLLAGLVLQPCALAVEIAVSTTNLSIPEPEGFVQVTSDMQPYAAFAKRFVPPSNEQFAMFITPADAAVAKRGEIPASTRSFNIQTAKTILSRFTTTSQFNELKSMVKKENDSVLKKAEAQMPGLLQKMSKGISDDLNVNLELALDQMVPFPPHIETDRSMAYSALLKYNLKDAEGKPSVLEGVVTVTFVHLKGKVIILYANSEKGSLEWCRTESQKWADAIIAANPSTGDVAARESKPSGFDWSRVLRTGLIGAVVGGIVGLIAHFAKKKKAPSR